MIHPSVRPPLSNIQAELLKLFLVQIAEKDLLELKTVMAKYLLDKARDKTDIIWDELGYTDEKLHQILDNE